MKVICPYCKQPAKLVGGIAIYRHRPDLHDKMFWSCELCKAWVGCHPGTENPLGRLANAELRAWKQRAHAAFDPVWQARFERKSSADPKYTKGMARGGRYKALAQALGITKDECHIGMFDIDMCQRVVEICSAGKIEA